MSPKLQVFISSTFTDLQEERQAAVEAILRAGHIPAGMELFAAGDKSQLETIQRWIDESDVYLLLLGARYGSIEPSLGKSYTQIEYEYALGTGKPLFAIVLSETLIDAKVKADGRNVLESTHTKELNDFRKAVLAKVCRIVDDSKDIKLAIHETILDFLRKYTFTGWVSGKDVKTMEQMGAELTRLGRENAALREELASARKLGTAGSTVADFQRIMKTLSADKLGYGGDEDVAARELTVLEWFYQYHTTFVSGMANDIHMSKFVNFLFYYVAPRLAVYELVEDQKVAGAKWHKVKTTKKGNGLIVYIKESLAKVKETAATVSASDATAKVAPGSPGARKDGAKSR
jgi:hypothetical protein